MATKLIKDHINVTAIAPGAFKSDINRAARDHSDEVAKRIPARRIGTDEDMAGVAISSPRAQAITWSATPSRTMAAWSMPMRGWRSRGNARPSYPRNQRRPCERRDRIPRDASIRARWQTPCPNDARPVAMTSGSRPGPTARSRLVLIVFEISPAARRAARAPAPPDSADSRAKISARAARPLRA